MILKREFYYVRHGQTEDNLGPPQTTRSDISLNATGISQARSLCPLPMQFATICCSPMKRTRETAELIAPSVPYMIVEDLKECSVWREMTPLGAQAPMLGSASVLQFLERVKRGLNQALSHPGPVLIVSHAGVHWAACCWMAIENYDWVADNCQLAHFFLDEKGNWRARRLS